MLFKLFGSMIVIAASSFLGIAFSKDCSRRPQELRAMQGFLQILENEISFMSSLLIDSFTKICRNSDNEATIFFKSTIHTLETNTGLSAPEAWDMAVSNNIGKTCFNKEDGAILASFGKMLGNTDLEGQIKNIRFTIDQLKLQEKKAEENKKKNESMYRSLGILGGIAIVIILV